MASAGGEVDDSVDAVIICSESETELARKFRDRVRTLTLFDGRHPRIELYCDMEMPGEQDIGNIDSILGSTVVYFCFRSIYNYKGRNEFISKIAQYLAVNKNSESFVPIDLLIQEHIEGKHSLNNIKGIEISQEGEFDVNLLKKVLNKNLKKHARQRSDAAQRQHLPYSDPNAQLRGFVDTGNTTLSRQQQTEQAASSPFALDSLQRSLTMEARSSAENARVANDAQSVTSPKGQSETLHRVPYTPESGPSTRVTSTLEMPSSIEHLQRSVRLPIENSESSLPGDNLSEDASGVQCLIGQPSPSLPADLEVHGQRAYQRQQQNPTVIEQLEPQQNLQQAEHRDYRPQQQQPYHEQPQQQPYHEQPQQQPYHEQPQQRPVTPVQVSHQDEDEYVAYDDDGGFPEIPQ